MIQEATTLLALALLGWMLAQRHRANAVLSKIPGPKRTSWFKGHLDQVYSPYGWKFHEMMEKFGPTSTYDNWFGTKMLYTFDSKAMYHILVKESNVWSMARGHILMNSLLFGDGLLSTDGEVHRRQRKQLMPIFSANHMREMVPIFNSITRKLRDTISKKVGQETHEIEMASWLSRTAFELIGQSGLGVSFDSLDDEEGAHPYSATIKNVVPLITKVFLWAHYLLPWAVRIGSREFRHAIAKKSPWTSMRYGEHLAYYMWNLSVKIFEEKKQALEKGDGAVSEQLTNGKDILSVLMNANMQADDENKLAENELLGQMSTLMFAAMDSTSSALARTLDLLSTHAEVQDKLRQEIVNARQENDGEEFTYDILENLPYLGAVCKEVLRLHPPVHRIIRTSNRDSVVPLGTPVTGTDGSQINEIFFPKGSDVYISLIASNRSEEIWGPDAKVWKPERWLSPLPSTVADARIPGVFANLMTFNAGSRSCIGFRFSQLEMKVVLAYLVESFKFEATNKEIIYDLSGVANPQVKDELDKGIQLPIKVTAVKTRSGL